MDSARFDLLTHAISATLSRRTLAGALGIGALALPTLAEAKKKRKKRKKKKIKRNAFGCVDVAKFCKNDGQCCSGICEGKKGKKTCQAHDVSTCQAGQTLPECGGDAEVDCTPTGGGGGVCLTTTGNAGYCFDDARCFDCTKDADCVPVCGSGAACAPCAVCASEGTTTVCVGLTEDSCDS